MRKGTTQKIERQKFLLPMPRLVDEPKWFTWTASMGSGVGSRRVCGDHQGEEHPRTHALQMGATQRAPNKERTILGGVRSTPRWATSRSLYMELYMEL